MDEKTLQIVKAGWAMFARYGFAKTTMSDIATEAGVARQTVYNAFSGKDDILRAVVRHAGEISLAEIQDAWRGDLTLEEKLAVFLRLGPESWYQAIQAAPDWGDLMDGMHKTAAAELSALEEKWVAAITALFERHKHEIAPRMPLDDIAAFFYTTAKNAKFGVAHMDDLKSRLHGILQATLALLKP